MKIYSSYGMKKYVRLNIGDTTTVSKDLVSIFEDLLKIENVCDAGPKYFVIFDANLENIRIFAEINNVPFGINVEHFGLTGDGRSISGVPIVDMSVSKMMKSTKSVRDQVSDAIQLSWVACMTFVDKNRSTNFVAEQLQF